MNTKIEEIANQLIKILKDNDFVIQVYSAYSTDSVYIKLDYGVCNSIRISDHEGKPNLCYRYNLIIGGEVNIIEEKYYRYYYNENTVKELIIQILFDREAKRQKYGKGYFAFMDKNKQDHMNDSKGFWKDAKLVTSDKPSNYVLTPLRASGIKKVSDCVIHTGNLSNAAVDAITNVLQEQERIEKSAKFKPGELVKVTASFDELVNYYVSNGDTLNEAKTHALQITGLYNHNIGTVLGVTKTDKGMFYSLELPMIPIEFIPENFIRNVK